MKTNMKALSIRQPWAWCILHAGKDIENRSWRTKFRGRLIVHASKTFDEAAYVLLRDSGIDLPDPEDLVRGAIVGSVEVVDVVEDSQSPWFQGPIGFVLENPQAITEPIPFAGMPGLFSVPSEVMGGHVISR